MCPLASGVSLGPVDQLNTLLQPYTNGTYVNFVDLDLGSRSTGDFTYLNMYYGTNVAELRAMKTTWNLPNVFQFEQSIPPLDDPPLPVTGPQDPRIA